MRTCQEKKGCLYISRPYAVFRVWRLKGVKDGHSIQDCGFHLTTRGPHLSDQSSYRPRSRAIFFPNHHRTGGFKLQRIDAHSRLINGLKPNNTTNGFPLALQENAASCNSLWPLKLYTRLMTPLFGGTRGMHTGTCYGLVMKTRKLFAKNGEVYRARNGRNRCDAGFTMMEARIKGLWLLLSL
jgi:hypothetical protein